ncbi:hypothetical protein O59_002060 [Cellvibrio sp. BR]|nr:hypothetical protein O59_002060 [Cellvibrio sp. BR]
MIFPIVVNTKILMSVKTQMDRYSTTKIVQYHTPIKMAPQGRHFLTAIQLCD